MEIRRKLYKQSRSTWLLWLIIGLCSFIELILFGADRGWIGHTGWRGLAFANGAFWPGLVGDWQANYPGQPVTMFVTYGFLHGGIIHLVVNMWALKSLYVPVNRRLGQAGILVVYTISMVGGAAAFLLLSNQTVPVVGASGAIFGLIGAITGWGFGDRRNARQSLLPVYRMIGILAAMNVALWWILDGQLAWQAHLGGFVTGWIAAVWIDSRRLKYWAKV
jgi:rhomboid protease GluP